MQAAR